MALPTCALFLAEVRGHSKLYDDPYAHGGLWFLPLSFLSFLLFTDFAIYWIHRWLHIPVFYKPLHKIHHLWKVPSPFASHAFHPIDGFMQSLPYHIYPFVFPLHKVLYLALFVFVNVWTVSIHDGDYRVPKGLRWIINGSCHHSDHHLKFTCNYGEYFTFWDRLGGTFREPSHYLGEGLHHQMAELGKTGHIKKAPVEFNLQAGEEAEAKFAAEHIDSGAAAEKKKTK
jgi:lathosterol oxidase